MENFFTKGPVKTEERPMTTKKKKAAFKTIPGELLQIWIYHDW